MNKKSFLITMSNIVKLIMMQNVKWFAIVSLYARVSLDKLLRRIMYALEVLRLWE